MLEEGTVEAVAFFSPSAATGLAHLRLDVENPVDMPVADSEQMLEIADAASSDGLQVGLGGQSIVQAEQGEIGWFHAPRMAVAADPVNGGMLLRAISR